MDSTRESMYLQQAAEQYASSLRQVIDLQIRLREVTEERDMLRLQMYEAQSTPDQNHTVVQGSVHDDVA